MCRFWFLAVCGTQVAKLIAGRRLDVLKRYGKGVEMDGRQSKKIESERPIAKPSFPLPMIFNRGRARSESPTLRRQTERVHFYRKDSGNSGTPTYGFYITNEPVEREAQNQK